MEIIKVPDVSIECLEAIELLLKKDPRERISLFDFLHHPWLQKYQKWKNRKIWNDCYSSSNESSDSLKHAVSNEGDEADRDDVDNDQLDEVAETNEDQVKNDDDAENNAGELIRVSSLGQSTH